MIPDLEAGASASVSVNLLPGFPDTNYRVTCDIFGKAKRLSAIVVEKVNRIDRETVSVTVRNRANVTVGGMGVYVVAESV